MPNLLDAPPPTIAPAPRGRSVVDSSPERVADPPPPRPLRVTVEMYHRMIEAGVFVEIEGRRVELIDEEIVEMSPAYPAHAFTVDRVADLFRSCIPSGWSVREEKPLRLPRSEPEPDIAVLNRAKKFWVSRHPGPSDTLLVVEVSDATLQLDRTRKARIYAAAGLSPYWIFNLPDRVLEVRTDPHPTADGAAEYRTLRTLGEGETLTFTLAEREFSIAVADLLPAVDAPPDGDGETRRADE